MRIATSQASLPACGRIEASPLPFVPVSLLLNNLSCPRTQLPRPVYYRTHCATGSGDVLARLTTVRAERTSPRVIVGAAIITEGRVLACARTGPPEVAGRWEFPGGKVEPGEREEAAVARECFEE